MVLYVRFHVWTLLIFCHSTYTSILSKKEGCYIFAYTGAISQFLRYILFYYFIQIVNLNGACFIFLSSFRIGF